MRAPLLPALALVVLAGAGCLSAAPPPGAMVEVCLEKPIEATWHEPGLGDGFAQAARRAGWDVLTEPPRDGFPAPMEDAAVFGFTWRPQAPLARPSVSLFDAPEPGGVAFGMQADPDHARAERVFLAFLERVGLQDAPERDEWVRTLVYGVDPAGVRQAPLFRQVEARAQPDLSEPLAALRGAPFQSQHVGGGLLEAGEWRAHVQVPVSAVTVPLEEGTLTVWTDAHGAFRGRTTVADPPRGWETFQTRLGTSFAMLGLPPPQFVGASGGGVPC